MRQAITLVLSMTLLIGTAGSVLADDAGASELLAAFNAGPVTSGENDPSLSPPGRIVPFLRENFICDEQAAGVFVFWAVREEDATLAEVKAFADAIKGRFVLDGEELDSTQTAVKRFVDDPTLGDGWWFADGVPVIGVMEAGTYELVWYPFGGPEVWPSTVYVDSAYCG